MHDQHRDDPAADPRFVVFRTANTPDEAQLIRALLTGAGIPAHIDGSLLTDEFAISQRMMNQQGVRVLVPSHRLEEAQEVIATAAVPDDELERQALEAGGGEAEPSARPAGAPHVMLAVGAFGLAFLFFSLWMGATSQASRAHPLYAEAPGQTPGDTVGRWRDNGAQAFRYRDANANGIVERVDYFNRDGDLVSTSYDEDEDGIYERIVEHREGRERIAWLDDDGDGKWDRVTVEAGDGPPLQELRFVAGRGIQPIDR